MSITRRRLKDGSYVYDALLEYGSMDGKRSRRKRTFRTRREAEDAEREAERLRGAMRNRTGRITLGEYVDLFYWPIASRRLEATSLDTYRRELDKRILPQLGSVKLDDLDRLRIQRMVDSCRTESVARKALGLLKTVLNEAVGDGFMASNPALARYALPPRGGKRDNGVVLGDFDKIRDFIEQVQEDAPDAVCKLVMTGLTLGLRPEERYALDGTDLDLHEGTVRVKGAYVTASAARGGNQMKRTKTAHSDRTIPMTRFFWEWVIFEDCDEGPWIVNRYGERLSPSTGRKMWNRYLDAHPDLPRVTLENMRHSFATACLNAGMNVEDLSRMLGHSDINTTYRRYVKPDMDNMRKGVEMLPGYVREENPYVTWY